MDSGLGWIKAFAWKTGPFVCFCQVAIRWEQRLIVSNVQTCSGTQILKCWSHSWRTHVAIVEAVMRPWKLFPSSFVISRSAWMKSEILQFARWQGVLCICKSQICFSLKQNCFVSLSGVLEATCFWYQVNAASKGLQGQVDAGPDLYGYEGSSSFHVTSEPSFMTCECWVPSRLAKASSGRLDASWQRLEICVSEDDDRLRMRKDEV